MVVADEAVARKGPAETFQPAFTRSLTEGTEFRVLQRRNGWLLIRLPGNEEGWIQRAAAVVY